MAQSGQKSWARGLNLRILEPIEWLNLQHILIDDFSEDLPDPSSTVIYALENVAGELVGFFQIEEVVHGRHIWIDPKYRMKGLAQHLAERMIEMFSLTQRPLIVAAHRKSACALAKSLGMAEVEGHVYAKGLFR